MSSNLVRRTTIVTSFERDFRKKPKTTGSKVRTGTAQNVCNCDFGDDVDDVLGEPLLPVFGGEHGAMIGWPRANRSSTI